MTIDSSASLAPSDGAAMSAGILEAVDYLDQCRRQARSFAVVTADKASTIGAALDRFIATLPPGCRVVRVSSPTDSHHTLLETILAQLGFEPFESTTDDLARLLTVVLRQSAGVDAANIVMVEDAPAFGPRVLETLRELARNSRDASPPPLLLLTGGAALNRVLDSTGMASVAELTRLRFDLSPQRAPSDTAARLAPAPAFGAMLELSLNDVLVSRHPLDRDRLLIGRGEHCDVCIASRFVSRQHALLVRTGEGDWLLDLKSTNGTSVNSHMIEQRRLEHRDLITIGNYRIRYDNPAATELAAPRAHSRDSLSETMVMRSLRGLHGSESAPPDVSSSSAA